MTHGSLFAGIGGFDLGFERAGIETSWQVEIDPYCRQVLAKNFPCAERFDDICECRGPYSKIGWGRHRLIAVDIVSGGFPCQDISNAGKRAGIDGDRSGLWSEMCRIVCELRPRYVVVENVAALLGRGLGRVLGDLAASGYDAEWDCIRASDVGAPHRRERVWIVAYPIGSRVREQSIFGGGSNGAAIVGNDRQAVADAAVGRAGAISAGPRREGERTADADGGSEPVEKSASAGFDGARTIIARAEEDARTFDIASRSDWWAVEPDVGRVAHGVPARVDRLRGLGNAVVPQIAEWLGRCILATETDQRKCLTT
jgi:DNA (cytosine-5)-methyltransferase 1